MRNTQKDGLVFGALLGSSLAFPEVGSYVTDFLSDIIPTAGQFMGDFSIPFYIIVGSILIGWAVDKT